MTYLKMPLRLQSAVDKKLQRCSYQESIAQHIMLLILSHNGEVIGREDFGSMIWDLEFNQLVKISDWEEGVKNSLIRTIEKYEKRLQDIDVNVFSPEDADADGKSRETDPFEEWQPGDTCYGWHAGGMLATVRTPEGKTVTFGYDALGRRVSKSVGNGTRRFGWDGNVVLHEWDVDEAGKPKIVTDATGREEYSGTEKPENLVTWVYDGTSFTPVAKVVDGERYTIVQDYLGTPTQAYDSRGELVWEMLLDMYGKVTECHGDSSIVPFRFQGMYYDTETELCYVRHRYYSADTGAFISQDPIGLAGGNPTLYGYVFDSNIEIDPFGLDCKPKGKKINRTVYRYSPPNRIATTWDTHIGNIRATHRYTKSGVGGVYDANSAKTAMAEISHWGVDPDSVVLVSKKVSLKNVLDLTDPKVRSQMGVDLADITKDSYDITHKLGDWAIENGYDGILAPSARNATGTNLIGFNGL